MGDVVDMLPYRVMREPVCRREVLSGTYADWDLFSEAAEAGGYVIGVVRDDYWIVTNGREVVAHFWLFPAVWRKVLGPERLGRPVYAADRLRRAMIQGEL